MKHHSILLVDDEANVLKSVRRQLFGSVEKIFTAESGEEGLEICSREQIALVISDYRMPVMNGVQFLAEVKERFPNTIRIILSGYADVSAIVDAVNDGQIYKFLPKPWNDQELLTTVKRALEHYELQTENKVLLQELKLANAWLQDLTDNLEKEVEDRTRDLASKNRALESAQRLLNLLPAGVLGVDNQGTLVYMNRAMREFTESGVLMLGEQLDRQLAGRPMELIRQAQKTQTTVCDADSGVRVVCSPLPDEAGVVTMFCHADLDEHRSMIDAEKEAAGEACAEQV